MEKVVINKNNNPGCLVQILWFAFIGWWLGQAWIAAAYIFMVTIIGIPIGITMLNGLPKVIALREPDRQVMVTRRADGGLNSRSMEPAQVNILLRAVYFILIGWWLAAVWMELAYWFCMTYIGLPVGFWMFDRVPALLTLKR